MTKSLNEASQELLKFLVKVIFEGQHYFAVWGYDTADEEKDKWLLDTNQGISLFQDIEMLSKNVVVGSNFKDNEKLKEWSSYLDKQSNPDNILDFDILKEDFDYIHPFLEDLYVLVGLIEDYAIQTKHSGMIAIFKSDLFMGFKDEAANTFLWTGQDEFNKDFDFTTLNKECRKIHEELRSKLSFPAM